MIILKLLLKFIGILNKEASPRAIAGGMALGMIIGLTPKGSLHNLVVLVFVLMLNVNAASAFVSAAAFAALAYLGDPLFNRAGYWLLTAAPFDFEQPETPAMAMATSASAADSAVVVRPIAEMEKQAIKAALQQTGGNRTKAADLLGISIRTLRNKLQEYRAEGDPDLVGAGAEDE